MSLQQAVEKATTKRGTILENILSVLDDEDRKYLIYLLAETTTPCSVISTALRDESMGGHVIRERTLQKERVKLVSEKNS